MSYTPRKCVKCDRISDKFKLWRMHGEYSPPFTLYCGPCAMDRYNTNHSDHVPVTELEADGSHVSRWSFSRKDEMTWELGWCVPAIEIEDGSGWWSNWSDNPDALVAWEKWKALLNG